MRIMNIYTCICIYIFLRRNLGSRIIIKGFRIGRRGEKGSRKGEEERRVQER